MRVEFLGGPRDGDYTYQNYSPPTLFYMPASQEVSSFYRKPVSQEATYMFAEYYVYELSEPVEGHSYTYKYIGMKNG